MYELITEELIEQCFLYCYKRIYNKNDAEDLAQTILLEVITALNNKKTIYNFYAWFWGVARNQTLLYFKRQEKKPVLIGYDYLDELHFEEESTENEELIAKVGIAITKISDMYRNIIISYYLKNLSIKKISSKLSISESAVKKRLFDAREKVKKEISKMEKTVVYDIPVVNLWGSNDWPNYWMYAETKIRKSILAVCYEKPLSINEMSEFLNINPLYLDDDVNILVDKKLLLKQNNKYETNIILYKKSEYNKYLNSVYEIFTDLAFKLNDIPDKYKDQIEKLFITNYEYDELKWAILPHICGLYSELSNMKIFKKYGGFLKTERTYYAEGVVTTSTDEDVQLFGSYLGWSNIHYNYLTSSQTYIGTSDLFEFDPFEVDRTKIINESNIDIIERVVRKESPIQSKKDELLFSELVKHKVIQNSKLAITSCKKSDWYQSFYKIVKDDLDSLVVVYLDKIESIINTYLLPGVKKNLYGDFYEMGIKSAFFPVRVVAKIAYDKKWIRNIDYTKDSWYGVTILLDNRL